MKNKSPWSTLELAAWMLWSSIVTGIFTICIVMTITEVYLISPLKKEAVERGYAEWQVNNSSGQTKFAWREKELFRYSF